MTGIKPACSALRRTALGVITARLRGVEQGRYRLRIPRVAGQMLKIRGMHFHVCPELFLQISGITRFSFPEDKFTLAPGEICIVPRGIPHGETVRAYRGPFCNLVVIYENQRLAYHLAQERPAGQIYIEAAEGIDHVEFSRFADYLDDAVMVYHGAYGCRNTLLKGILLTLFAALQAALEMDISPAQTESFKVAQTRQLVMANLADASLSVRQLAQRIRCSPDYLSWLFHKETGRTLSRFINDQRMAQARYLLEKSALNISEIAWASGYGDPGYFTRCFRQASGMAPVTYRRNLRGSRMVPG